MRLQSRCWLGLQSSKGLNGPGDLLPRWFTHMPSKLVLVVGRSQFLNTWPSISHNVQAQSNDPRQSKTEAVMSFLTQPWESHLVISIIFYQLRYSGYILPYSVWEGSNYTRKESLGTIWQAGYHVVGYRTKQSLRPRMPLQRVLSCWVCLPDFYILIMQGWKHLDNISSHFTYFESNSFHQ